MNANSRYAHFLFAVWATTQDEVPSIATIMALTGLHYNSAQQWRTDWLKARALHHTTPRGTPPAIHTTRAADEAHRITEL